MNLLLTISRAIDALNERIGRLVLWLVLVMVLVSAANAISRYLLNISSNAWLELQWYLFAAVFLLCAGYTLLHNEHIRIDVVVVAAVARAPGSWIDIFGTVFFLLPMAVVHHVAVLADLHERVGQRRDLEQRRRPDPLAGAAAGAGRLLPARRCRACRS